MTEPTYRESIRIGWSLLWRAVGSFIALLFLINVLLLFAMPELARTGPSLWASLLPLAVASAVSLLLIMPLIVRALLAKRFCGFHLQLVHDGSRTQGLGPLGTVDASKTGQEPVAERKSG